MTGGWGKRHAALFIGVAAIALLNNGAGAQQASVYTAPPVRQPPQQAASTATATTTTVPRASAQGVTPSLVVNGSVRSSIDYNDNGRLLPTSPGDDTRFVTSLNLGISSTTPTQSLDLSFGGDLVYEDLATGREENGFEKPQIRFDYSALGPDSRVAVNGRYQTVDVIDSIFVDTDGDLIDDTLLTSFGTAETIDVGAQYSFGIQAPFGMDFNVRRRERNYSDTISPNLFDRTDDTYGVTARFRINPTLTARLIANEARYRADNPAGTERDRTNYGVGVDYLITPDLQFTGQVTQTDIEQRTIGSVTNTDGISASASLTRTLTNGTIGVSASRTQNTNNTRSDISLNRSMALPSGSLAYSLGFSDSDTGSSAVIASLAYSNVLPTGTLSANLNRTATTNANNAEVERTVLTLGYNHNINSVSGINFGINYAEVNGIGLGAVQDATRTDLRVTYRRQLTQDWDWTLGYVHRNRSNAAGSSANSNAVVTSIGRSFSIRP